MPGVLPFETVENEARAADPALFGVLRDRAAEASAAWQALGQILDSRAGADAPPTSQVRDLLDQIHEAAERWALPEAERGGTGRRQCAAARGGARRGGMPAARAGAARDA